MIFVALLIGVILAVALLAAVASVGLHRDRAFYTAILIGVAAFYPVFAIERLDYSAALVQLLVAGGFVALALSGYRAGAQALGSVFLIHALYDVVALPLGIHAPLLWPELCLSFDLVFAAAARALLR